MNDPREEYNRLHDHMSAIAVIGTGCVGLVSGACLADFGNQVTCVDVDQRKIERPKCRRDPDIRTGVGRRRLPQPQRRSALFHHRPSGRRSRERGDFHRGRDSVCG